MVHPPAHGAGPRGLAGAALPTRAVPRPARGPARRHRAAPVQAKRQVSC